MSAGEAVGASVAGSIWKTSARTALIRCWTIDRRLQPLARTESASGLGICGQVAHAGSRAEIDEVAAPAPRDDRARNAEDDAVLRNVLDHHRVRADRGAVRDAQRAYHLRAGADVHALAEDRRVRRRIATGPLDGAHLPDRAVLSDPHSRTDPQRDEVADVEAGLDARVHVDRDRGENAEQHLRDGVERPEQRTSQGVRGDGLGAG